MNLMRRIDADDALQFRLPAGLDVGAAVDAVLSSAGRNCSARTVGGCYQKLKLMTDAELPSWNST